MTTDTEIKIKGIEVLTKALSPIETERYISLILREPFDYTQWQKNLWLINRSMKSVMLL